MITVEDRPKPMRLVYVAGPFRDSSAWEVENNIRRAEFWSLAVWRNGAAAICPHANTRYFDGVEGVSAREFLDGTLSMLAVCDAMLVVTDRGKHAQSSGTLAEIQYAKDWRIPTFYTHNFDAFIGWCKK